MLIDSCINSPPPRPPPHPPAGVRGGLYAIVTLIGNEILHVYQIAEKVFK